MKRPNHVVRDLAVLLAAVLAAPLRSQDLDESWTVTVNGRSVTANPDGSFFIPDIPVRDSFGPEGPGSPPDSLSDSFLRLSGTSTIDGVTRQVFSEPFQIRRGETFSIRDLTFEGPPFLRALRVATERSVLLVGESLQLAVTGILRDGGAVDLTPNAQYTTYLTSNSRVATVGPDGLLTARGRGRTFITAENGGVTAVTRIDVASGTLRLRLSGLVRLPDGTVAAGASIRIPRYEFETLADMSGSFDIAVDALLDVAFSVVVTFESGGQRFSKPVELEAAEGLELIDLGSIRLAAEPPPADLFLPRVFESGGRPFAMASADLDGDGDPDLAAVHRDNRLGILRNQGDATFAARVQYLGGSGIGSVALGDLDGDGAADAAVTTGSGLRVLRNLGDGTFAAHGQYASSAGGMVLGDVDQDGDSDLAVAFGNVFVLQNQGDGTFAAPIQFAAGNSVLLALGDVDVDGDADLVAADSSSTRNVSMLRNQGDGTFAARVIYDVGPFLQSVALSDLDGDDVPEVAVSIHDAGAAGVLRNRGDGTFQPVVQYAAGLGTSSVVAGDMDGDGIADLATANATFSDVSVLRNRGDGTFAAQVLYTAGFRPRAVILDDFDGDGDRDLAVANEANVQVFPNQGGGTFASHYALYNTGRGTTSVAIGDADGDGDADLAVAYCCGFGVGVLRNGGSAAFGAPVQYLSGSGFIPTSIRWEDLDGDGDADLGFANNDRFAPSVVVLRNQGDATLAAAVPYAVETSPVFVVAGDLDRDGDADLVTANPLTSSVSVLLNQGDATFAERVSYNVGGAVGGGRPFSLASGDLTGDGHADLAVVGGESFGHIGILRNQGDGTFTPHARIDVGGDPLGIALGDLDGDGDADLAVTRTLFSEDPSTGSTGIVVVLRNQGGGTFAAPEEFHSGDDSRQVAMEDLDQDGDVDLAVANTTSAAISVLRNLGGGTFAAPLAYGVVANPVSFALGDLDGDGDPDVATAMGHDTLPVASVLLNQTVK